MITEGTHYNVKPGEIIHTITQRELQILEMVSHGRKSYEVAKVLGTAANTVKNQLHDLYRRIDVHNAPHAVAMALRNGWIN